MTDNAAAVRALVVFCAITVVILWLRTNITLAQPERIAHNGNIEAATTRPPKPVRPPQPNRRKKKKARNKK